MLEVKFDAKGQIWCLRSNSMLKVKYDAKSQIEFKNFITSANYLKKHFSFSFENWSVTHFPIYLYNFYFNDKVKASK